MKNVFNVMRFEYKGFVSAKSFRVITIVFVVCIIAAMSLPQLIGVFRDAGIGGEKSGKDKAALILSGEALTNELYKAAFTPEALGGISKVEWVDLSKEPPGDAALSQAVKDGEYLFALRYAGGTPCEFFAAGNRMASYTAIAPISDYITGVVKQVNIAALPADARDAVVRISALEAEPEIIDIGGNAQNNFWIGYVLIMFLFYVIMGYTNYVSSSIVTEKTSKAMELLVTSVKPLHLMVGKVLGVGFAALTQVGAIVAAAAVGLLANLPYWRTTGSGLAALTQGGNVDASIVCILIVYFLLGFFLYAFIAAAFASTVTKPEEAATVTTLPIVLMMAALGLGFLTLSGAAGKTLVAGLSYIPFFTPITMVARYTIGDASAGRLVLGAAILAAATFAVATLAAKIFRMGVMLYGVKATPKQIWKALKSS
ncbi:MAG: ABC transporter permease [Clostridiales Family XIII bacterium]|jgi:ABC-2 type transport system permease protein|nr:ABC transporter permease [Clostridiales Family XIII bacterium]